MNPLINIEFVIAVHDEILKQTGVGRAGFDRGMLESVLESVLGRIDQQINYNNVDDIFKIGAWYAIAIAKGHAFVDGNKRTGLAVMLTFLEIQGVEIYEESQLDDLMVSVVESKVDHEELATDLADAIEQRIKL